MMRVELLLSSGGWGELCRAREMGFEADPRGFGNGSCFLDETEYRNDVFWAGGVEDGLEADLIAL